MWHAWDSHITPVDTTSAIHWMLSLEEFLLSFNPCDQFSHVDIGNNVLAELF